MIGQYGKKYIINYKKNGVLRVKKTTLKIVALSYLLFNSLNNIKPIRKIGIGIIELDYTEPTPIKTIKNFLRGKI